ncbi:MAG: VOC family protein [Myxococcota bacterium]|nr:VOC family protein [Myxococcota bacterium]
MPTHTDLTPRLIVDAPQDALDYYASALGADLIEHFADPEGRVVHAAFAVGDAVVSLAESVPSWGLLSPQALGGSPCLLHLTVDDPDATATRMVEGGGRIVIEIEDRPWGKREGRVADPSGHLWILSTPIEDVSDDEIRRRLHATAED